jgi:hypothetical protein
MDGSLASNAPAKADFAAAKLPSSALGLYMGLFDRRRSMGCPDSGLEEW